LKQVNSLFEEEKERSGELEAQLQDLQQNFNQKSQTWQEQEQRYKMMIDQTQDHAKQIEMAANALKNESLVGLESQLKEKTEQHEDLSKKLKALEEKMFFTEEDLKQRLQQNLKDMAIKDQKLEFYEI